MSLLKRAALWPLALAILCAPIAAWAQAKPVAAPGNYVPPAAIAYGDMGQPATMVGPSKPLPIICMSGCSATGAGTATADPPALVEGQSAGLNFDLSNGLRISGGGGGGGGGAATIADGADVAQGDRSDAAWAGSGDGTVIAILKSIRSLEAGTRVVSGTVSLGGSLPAFAATPTFNLGTIGSAATAANQSTAITSLSGIDTDLGAPADAAWSGSGSGSAIAILKSIRALQAGGFAITGTLPAFASTPTFNLGTIGSAATAANQATAISTLSAVSTALGTPADAAYSGAGSASSTAILKGIYGLLGEPAVDMPPRALSPSAATFLIGHVNKSNTGATTILAADASKAYSLYGVLLSIGGATTLTFECGTDDLVLDFQTAGLLDLSFREYPYCTSTTNNALSITSSNAVAIKGKIYAGKE